LFVVVAGSWSLGSVSWFVLVIYCQSVSVPCLLAVAGWWLLIRGCWLVVSGYWSVVVGCWSVVIGQGLLFVRQWLLINGCWVMVLW
jgi:hypothetical protein